MAAADVLSFTDPTPSHASDAPQACGQRFLGLEGLRDPAFGFAATALVLPEKGNAARSFLVQLSHC